MTTEAQREVGELLVGLLPADDDPATYFHGHDRRECGEHRTVGAHRAWCYDCAEWCYPRTEAACRGCELPSLRAELAHIEAERDDALLAAEVATGTPCWRCGGAA